MAGQLAVIDGATWHGTPVASAIRMPAGRVLLGLTASPWRVWAEWAQLGGIVDDPRVREGEDWLAEERRHGSAT